MEPDHTQSDSAQSGETQLEGTQSGDTADLTFSGVGPDTAPASADASRAALAEMAARAGLRRVHMLAWRDLYDPEAGGSEVHASTVAKLWAEAGIEVTMRSSYAQGHPPVGTRDGYHVIRKAGRYMVFPRAAVSELRNKYGPRDGLVEIWNGMPFLSPLWAIGPRIVFLHHLHGEMWKMTLPPNLARMGEILEFRVAPPLYRRTRIVTVSYSSRDELVHEGFLAGAEIFLKLRLAFLDAVHGDIVKVTLLHRIEAGNHDGQALGLILLLLEELHDAGAAVELGLGGSVQVGAELREGR